MDFASPVPWDFDIDNSSTYSQYKFTGDNHWLSKEDEEESQRMNEQVEGAVV